MLDELYQDVIMDHNARPKNYGRLTKPTNTAKGHNPICGDTIVIDIHQDGDGTISEISFESNGCAISKAAASIMTDSVNEKSAEEIEEMMNRFIEMTTNEVPGISFETEGDMAAFSGVRMYPSRIKCANLPWHTLKAALQGDTAVSTE